jgi:hypothetical protein
MYIVIPTDSNGKLNGKAFIMPKEQYARLCKIMTCNKPELHIVDESKISEYPKDLFTDAEVKRYVKKIK